MPGLSTVMPEAVGKSPSPNKAAFPGVIRWTLPG